MAVLDLNGATVNLSGVNKLHGIKDSVGGGSLVVAAGSTIYFFDCPNCGFDSTLGNSNILINGTPESNCLITSAVPNPIYKWKMPPKNAVVDIRYCLIQGNDAFEWGADWVLASSHFAEGALCSIEQFKAYTGTDLGHIDSERLIEMASAEVRTMLSLYKVSASPNDYRVSSATVYRATIHLINRYRMDGTKPMNLTIGDLSITDNIDVGLAKLDKMSWELLMDYVRSTSTGGRWRRYLRKVNA